MLVGCPIMQVHMQARTKIIRGHAHAHIHVLFHTGACARADGVQHQGCYTICFSWGLQKSPPYSYLLFDHVDRVTQASSTALFRCLARIVTTGACLAEPSERPPC